MEIILIVVGVVVLLLVLLSIHQVNQYERGLRFTMGRFFFGKLNEF